MRGKEIAKGTREAIVKAKENGSTDRQVAALFGISRSAVSKIYSRFKTLKTVNILPRSGRPRKSTEKDDRALVRIIKKNPRMTGTDITRHANNCLGLGITTRTARNILK